ncbi:MAG TPA: hypothetical protein VG797_04495 [Phycisphaerales bacterium]|nr:hypothetical protein [Phycisphaerales bacterium]
MCIHQVTLSSSENSLRFMIVSSCGDLPVWHADEQSERPDIGLDVYERAFSDGCRRIGSITVTTTLDRARRDRCLEVSTPFAQTLGSRHVVAQSRTLDEILVARPGTLCFVCRSPLVVLRRDSIRVQVRDRLSPWCLDAILTRQALDRSAPVRSSRGPSPFAAHAG